MEKNHFSIALIVFFSCFLFACGKAPNTVKVLRGLNNAVANYWLDLVQKNGVNYVDYDGESIIAIALEAENIELLQATIKDGADLHREYNDSEGRKKYPLQFYLFTLNTRDTSNRDFNTPLKLELIKTIVDAGTELQFLYYGSNILFRTLYWGNIELFNVILPGFIKQKLLDYSNYEYPENLLPSIVYAMNDEEGGVMLNKLVEAGMKLPKDMVENYIASLSNYPDNPAPFESVLKMAGVQKHDAEAIISRPKHYYIAVMSPDNFNSYGNWLMNEPDSQAYGNSIKRIGIGEKFEFLETGKESTIDGITAPWFKVRTADGRTTAWIFSGFFREESAFHYVTTSNVNLRYQEYVDSYLVTVLPEGTMVKLREIGRSDTIDGITAPWYMVETSVENINWGGWIFSGYLRQMEK